MKTFKLFFIISLLCFSNKICTAQTAEHKTYDYITITAPGAKPEVCFVSINGEKYERIELSKPQGLYDYSEVIKIIKNYEKAGYEVFANNSFAADLSREIYFLLRKEQKE